MDPTVELVEQDERDWQAERQEELAAISWQKCEDCNGLGFNVEHLEADAGIFPPGRYGYAEPDYVLHNPCETCDGQGHIQLHDPVRVTALFAAADDARERMGVWCYTRIASALSLAINGNVSFNLDGTITVKSATVNGGFYHVAVCCDCYDAYYQAPKIEGKPHCKHQIAVWLVKTAEKKMSNG